MQFIPPVSDASPSPFVSIALFGWLIVPLLLYTSLPRRTAIALSVVLPWLFLPIGAFACLGYPDYTKATAIALGALIAIILLDITSLTSQKLKWFDTPAIAWCIIPLFSSLSVGRGYYSGLSATLQNILLLGIPYFLGRIYFIDRESTYVLAKAILIGGLLYVPVCLYEIRMSPILHYKLYGFHQHTWIQAIRFGGWRPTAFLSHGLAVAGWMALVSVVAYSLWRSKPIAEFSTWPLGLVLASLLLITIFCKSVNGWIMLAIGILMIEEIIRFKTRLLVYFVAALLCGYIVCRLCGLLATDEIVSLASSIVPESRAESLRERLEQEDILGKRALLKPLLGWGPWGDFRLSQGEGDLVKATDGMWLIVLGKYGILGVTSFFAVFLYPCLGVLRQVHTLRGTGDGAVTEVSLGVLLLLHCVDNLMNACINPVFPLVAGGLSWTLSSCTVCKSSRSAHCAA